MGLFRFVFRFIGLILSLIFLLPVVLFLITYAQKKQKRKLNKKVINLWSKHLCYVCGLSLSTKGVIQKNPVFIVANHVSWLDIPVIHCYKLVGYVAKAEIANWPILGFAAKCGDSIFIARGKHESRKEAISAIKNRLQEGRSIAVFPEGRATDGNQLARFHRQLIHSAIEEKATIQAIAIKYLDKKLKRNNQVSFKKDESFIKNVFRILSLPPSTVELTFCEPIDSNKFSAKKAAETTYNQVAQVLAENDYL